MNDAFGDVQRHIFVDQEVVVGANETGLGDLSLQVRVVAMVEESRQSVFELSVKRQVDVLNDYRESLVELRKVLPLFLEDRHIVVDQSAETLITHIFVGPVKLNKP